MTILSSGSTYSLTIPAGNALVTLDLSGTSTVTGVTREDASRWHGAGAKACNPVSTATAITIRTTGQVDYRFVAGDATPSSDEIHYNPVTYDMSSSDAAAVAAATGLGQYRRQVASRCGAVGDTVTNIQQFQSRSWHQIFTPCVNPVVQFSNEKIKSTMTNPLPTYGSAVTIKAALEYNGTIYPLTFSGQRVATIADGSYLDADPMGITLPVNARVFIRQLVTLVTTAGNPGMLLRKCNSAVLNTTATDLDACETTTNVSGAPLTDKVDSGTIGNTNGLASGATPTSNANSAIAWPCAITALIAGDNHANLLLGDSISEGSNDYPDKVGSGAGILERTIGKKAPWINVSAYGYTSWQYGGQSNNYLLGSRPAGIVAARLAGYCSRVVCGMVQNQLTTNTAAQVFGDHKVMMENLDYLSGRPLDYVFTTAMPRTTSTDSWATTVNQTVSYSSLAAYQNYNAYVRAGTYSGYTGRSWVGYIDFGGLVESSLDSGIWIAGYTADGIHPVLTGYKALEAGAVIRVPNAI